jgi:hypothetical protein
MHKQTKKLRKLMHNNKSSEEAMALLSLENFKLKPEQTTTLKNSANLRADLHGERERKRELQMLLYPFPKQSSAFKDHGMREGLELQMILYPFPKQISAFQEHSLREI